MTKNDEEIIETSLIVIFTIMKEVDYKTDKLLPRFQQKEFSDLKDFLKSKGYSILMMNVTRYSAEYIYHIKIFKLNINGEEMILFENEYSVKDMIKYNRDISIKNLTKD